MRQPETSSFVERHSETPLGSQETARDFVIRQPFVSPRHCHSSRDSPRLSQVLLRLRRSSAQDSVTPMEGDMLRLRWVKEVRRACGGCTPGVDTPRG